MARKGEHDRDAENSLNIRLPRGTGVGQDEENCETEATIPRNNERLSNVEFERRGWAWCR